MCLGYVDGCQMGEIGLIINDAYGNGAINGEQNWSNPHEKQF